MKKTLPRYVLYAAFLFCALFLAPISGEAAAQTGHDQPTIDVEQYGVTSDTMNGILIALWITPAEGSYFYALDPGGTGRPVSISPTETVEGLTVRYPKGTPKPDIFDPDVIANVHDKPTPFFIYIPAESGKTSVTLSVSMLVCTPTSCQPVRKVVSSEWPERSGGAPRNGTEFSPAPALKPTSDDSESITENATSLSAQKTVEQLPSAQEQTWWPTLPSLTVQQPEARPLPATKKMNGSTPTLSTDGKGLPAQASNQLPSVDLPTAGKSLDSSLSLAPKEKTIGMKEGEFAFTPRFFLKVMEVASLGKAILFGLIAGLILNAMPCVLPVISLKLSSLVSASVIADRQRRISAFREHNIFFALGIITWFLLLAIILTLAGLVWGQIFQSEAVVTGLMLIVFILGLSIFGIFELPMFNLKTATASDGKWSAFSTGVLATLLATPCSGPFLGGVLGWAFLQPPVVLAAIFLSVGFGMALPYFGLALFPGLVRHFPKPGNWTGVLEKLVGFFLMGTTAYLLTILPESSLPAALALLWSTAVGAWIWGTFGGLTASPRRRVISRICAAILVVVTVLWGYSSTPDVQPWRAYNKGEFTELLGKKRMLVDFTADWCPSCKVLESTVLTDNNRAEWAKQYGLTYIKVDMTRLNPEAQKLLKALGSQSIPVVALFSKGKAAAAPIVLRDLFTTDQLEAAMEEAFPR